MFKKAAATGASLLPIMGAMALMLAPLGASAQTMASKSYEVTITNLTSKQVMSPPILVTHSGSAHVWQVGQTASDGVKTMAEEGKNDKLAAEVKGVATDVVMADGPLMPGKSVTLKIMAHEGDVLSAASMLVQTNDTFTGLDNMPLSGAMGDKDTMAYDAGTEENTEVASDIPGPPFGGHNQGTATQPRQAIAMSPGITGKADVGLEYNWSGPAARFSVHAAMMEEGAMSGGEKSSMSGEGAMMSGNESMPKTGAGDTAGWFTLAGIAVLMLASGATLKRVQVRSKK